MDYVLLALVVAVIGVAFYAALRAYSRRQLRHGHRSPDKD
jgi:hypothetical protein